MYATELLNKLWDDLLILLDDANITSNVRSEIAQAMVHIGKAKKLLSQEENL